jgi:hypothetical protein
MAREDWRDREDERRWRAREDFGQADYSEDYVYDPRARSGRRASELDDRRDDYGQADYTTDWAYDPERGRPYRRNAEQGLRDDRYDRDLGEHRSWRDRAAELFGARPHSDERREAELQSDRYDDERRRRRRGPSDRVLWAVIMQRLDDARVDSRDVEVRVVDGEVTLDGTVRRRADKRRIEDLVDVDGVRNVQNNLRPRDVDRHWTFL